MRPLKHDLNLFYISLYNVTYSHGKKVISQI